MSSNYTLTKSRGFKNSKIREIITYKCNTCDLKYEVIHKNNNINNGVLYYKKYMIFTLTEYYYNKENNNYDKNSIMIFFIFFFSKSKFTKF